MTILEAKSAHIQYGEFSDEVFNAIDDARDSGFYVDEDWNIVAGDNCELVVPMCDIFPKEQIGVFSVVRAAEILIDFQRWRNGGDNTPPTAKEVGEAIEFAINEMRKLSKSDGK